MASILTLGIIVRAILIPISAHPLDVYVWYKISTNILENGPFSLQSFPPMWYHYMLIPIAYIYSWLSSISSSGAIQMASLPPAFNFYPTFNIQYVPGWLFNSIVKIPFLISDIGITILLYRIVKELTKSKALADKAAFLWFLNPFVIWISAAWGTWDTLPALFCLVAFFFVLKKKISIAALCLSIGFALKLYPALFLVPLAIYIIRTSQIAEKWRNTLKFFSVFASVSVLLFLPYFGTIENFFSTYYFAPSPGLIADPVSYPVGYGLSFWSIYLLNRLIDLPVTTTFVSFASITSIILVAIALVLVYWRSGKVIFERPVYDLSFVLLLPLIALFLSYRMTNEQYFVWAIPFLVILCLGGRIKPIYYFGASIIAFAYAVLNCPLPFFFLPLAPWYTNTLLSIIHAILAIDPLRIVLLAILGSTFSILMIIILFQLLKVDKKASSQI